ncbi:hypothetical protein CONCODRAFT_6758 [Conidiobolus coronatus NRRL 28638]|uniref:F-box domain-containing protein n=1 Tax=Conidiobolus coronatus (strain ATCC 28846 / CBS 209.66 / NRRL 28638) TaxID=796925 RepID=A0A137P6Q1_CONC2|nr:hypothetical protein CONCODRAFT_6758 [Conidiobolus coronatus NRRL 28638]|eukprot:KXN70678.1 hypothetical protein CONCODRAFT_6758 [Conidiobolus coronatus NRRL 28638]
MILRWVDVISWKEFNCYLAQSEIAELSLSSKLWRKKLVSIVFRKIGDKGVLERIQGELDFSSSHRSTDHNHEKMVHNALDEKINCIPDVDESIQDESSYLEECDCADPFQDIHDQNCNIYISTAIDEIKVICKEFQYYAISLKVCENSSTFPYHYHYIVPYIECFSNLKHLNLSYTICYQDRLNTAFSKLSKLESLVLKNIEVICEPYCYESVVNIELPRSLKSLYISRGKIHQEEYENDHSDIDYDGLLEECLYLTYRPANLPNLKKLIYISDIGNFDNIVGEFFTLNPQLEYLGSSKNGFTTYLLDQISSQSNLKHIEIFQEEYDSSTGLEIRTNPLHSVESLYVSVGENIDLYFTKIITSACLNISHLSLNIEHYWGDLIEDFYDIFSKLTRLRVLTIYDYNCHIGFILSILKGPSIQRLNLVDYDLDSLNLSLIEQQSNIKHVHISYKSPNLTKIKLELNISFQKNLNWRMLVFYDSINCYKIDN